MCFAGVGLVVFSCGGAVVDEGVFAPGVFEIKAFGRFENNKNIASLL